MDIQYILDKRFGIVLYRNALKNSDLIIEALENVLSKNNTGHNKWKEATTGDGDYIKSYRNCYDFHISESILNSITEDIPELTDIYMKTKDAIVECLYDYETRFNIRMDYMEEINYIKYGIGQHFKQHGDDGFSYSSTVSTVAYLNDDYEGGELAFNNLGFKIKPKIGDIILFPSNFIFMHEALPVKSGVKYSAVTMFDYNSRFHHSYTGNDNGGKEMRNPKSNIKNIKKLDNDYIVHAI
jgi:hypothetical protein